MKKLIVLCLTLIVALNITSCKEDKKKSTNKEKETLLSIEAQTTSVNWIAYKTTEKVGVKGKFTELEILNARKAKTAKEALNGIKFKISTNSLFTKDSIRDTKLKKFFFGKMIDTENIEGTIQMKNENSGTVELKMNGISQVLPISYVIDGQMVNIEAVMNLDNWKAQAAIASLNEVCKDLHTGKDGISKTWSEVKIEVITYLKAE